VAFVIEETAQEELIGATVQWLEDLLAADAAGVLLGGVQRSEVVPGRPGWVHCFFPSVDVGPYRVQVRLTCVFSPPSPGRIEVRIVEVNPGVMNQKTRELEFQKDPRQLLEASSEVEMTWRLGSRGALRVLQSARQTFRLKVPWWFPVPDALTEAVLRPFVRQAIRSSQAGVFKTLRQRLAAAKLRE